MVCALFSFAQLSLLIVTSVLVNNLHIHVKPMYQLYSILKDRDEPLTHAEIDVASAKWQLDGNREHEFLEKLNRLSGNIKKAFQDQQARAVVSDNYLYLCMQLIKSQQGPWNQEKFEKALMEWIIACDQPFDEVEKPEFIALMMITHHASGLFKIPKRDGIKQRVMKMGEETIEGV
jgi:hypothetical protein